MKFNKAIIPFLLVWVFLGLAAVLAHVDVMFGSVLSLMAFLFVAVFFGVTNVPEE